jgi:hypothetical protein
MISHLLHNSGEGNEVSRGHSVETEITSVRVTTFMILTFAIDVSVHVNSPILDRMSRNEKESLEGSKASGLDLGH